MRLNAADRLKITFDDRSRTFPLPQRRPPILEIPRTERYARPSARRARGPKTGMQDAVKVDQSQECRRERLMNGSSKDFAFMPDFPLETWPPVKAIVTRPPIPARRNAGSALRCLCGLRRRAAMQEGILVADADAAQRRWRLRRLPRGAPALYRRAQQIPPRGASPVLLCHAVAMCILPAGRAEWRLCRPPQL